MLHSAFKFSLGLPILILALSCSKPAGNLSPPSNTAPSPDAEIPVDPIVFANPGLTSFSTPSSFKIIDTIPNFGMSSPFDNLGEKSSIFVSFDGDDSFLGTSEDEALKTVSEAFTRSSMLVPAQKNVSIYISEGRFFGDNVTPTVVGVGILPYDKNFAISGAGREKTLLINGYDPSGVTWVDNADGTYTATLADISFVIDLKGRDSFGNPLPLTVHASMAALLGSNEGSYLSGGNITVKTPRSIAPDDDIVVMKSSNTTLDANRNGVVTLENLSLIGWGLVGKNETMAQDPNQTLWVKGCLTGYTTSPDVLATYGNLAGGFARLVTIESDVAYAGEDGLNYTGHSFGIEYKIRAYGSGRLTGTPQDQNSTAHKTSAVLRFKSEYSGAPQDDIADVNESQAWVIDSTVGTLKLQTGYIQSSSVGSIYDVPTDYYFYHEVDLNGPLPTNWSPYEP